MGPRQWTANAFCSATHANCYQWLNFSFWLLKAWVIKRKETKREEDCHGFKFAFALTKCTVRYNIRHASTRVHRTQCCGAGLFFDRLRDFLSSVPAPTPAPALRNVGFQPYIFFNNTPASLLEKVNLFLSICFLICL